MENEKNNLPEDSWFDNLLPPEGSDQEIGADELAVAGSGLTNLGDMELEKILREAALEESDPVAEEMLLAPDSFDLELVSIEEPSELTAEASEDPIPEHLLSDDVLPEQPAEIADEEPALSADADIPTDAVPSDEPQQDASQADAPEKSAPATASHKDDRPQRKVRPKRKKGYGMFGLPHLASVAIWFFIAVTIGVSFGRLLWVCASDILAFGREDQKISITITESDTLDSITNKLYNAGLIKYRELFKLYGQLAQLEEKNKIKPGTYELNTLYDYHALVDAMSSTKSRKEIEVTIPEGYTCAQIFKLLEDNGICTVEKLEKYAETSKFSSYEFLDGMERGNKYCLDGFLFPDTYKFYQNDDPRNIFHKMLSRFDEKFDDEMEAQIDELNLRLAQMYRRNGQSQEYIDQHKITVYELVTIASMIEKETAHSGESQRISAVIYNRLTNPGQFPYLNIDATIVYALGGKTNITPEDTQFDHPYNTYVYKGLPPGAISNPGLFSLKAALAPAEEGYYYYALDPAAGEHHFSKTYQEHLDFLATLG